MSRSVGGVLAAYTHIDAATDAIKSLRKQGYEGFTVYNPAPLHEIDQARGLPISSVRLWTLFGGLAGCTLGFWMTIWMSRDYALIVGGKPIASWIPYVVIGFELTILIGALSTLAGLAFNIFRTKRRNVPYDGRFSDDHIGIYVPCPIERRPAVEGLLRDSGATEVKVETV